MTDQDAAALRAELARLDAQEPTLRLPTLDVDLPWRLGNALRDAALARGAALTIEVRIAGETQFFHAMPGTVPANADWARRKRNVVELLGRSSWAIGRQLALDGTTLEAKMGLVTRDHAPHGGSLPLVLASGVRVGTVTVSGLPQREDHELVAEVLRGLTAG